MCSFVYLVLMGRCQWVLPLFVLRARACVCVCVCVCRGGGDTFMRVFSIP